MSQVFFLDSHEVAQKLSNHDKRLEYLETLPAGGGGGGLAGHNAAINFVFERGGAILVNTMGIALRVHFAGTILRWTVISPNATGTIRFNVAKATFAAFPTFTNIDGTDPPQLASQNKRESTMLTGWTTGFATDDIFYVTVDTAVAISVVNRVTVILEALPV